METDPLENYSLKLPSNQYWPAALHAARQLVGDLREAYPMYSYEYFAEVQSLLHELELEQPPKTNSDTLRIVRRLGDILLATWRVRRQLES